MKQLFIAALLLLTFSCRKNYKLLAVQTAVSDAALYCIREYKPGSDTLIACGGSRYLRGDIFFSYDNGNSWLAQKGVTGKALYDIQFIDDTTICAIGYDGKLLISKNSGYTWTLKQLDYIPLRRMMFDNNELFIVGGNGLRKGIIYRCNLNGDVLQRDTFQNELSDIFKLSNGTLMVCGFGIVMRSNDQGNTWQTEDAEGDFFTCFVVAKNTIHVVGVSGTVLKYEDSKWTVVSKGNSIFRSGVYITHSAYQPYTERWVLCGKNNALFEMRSGGRFRHTPIQLENESVRNYNYACAHDHSFLLVTDEGTVIKLPAY